ncbi:MAG: hypothetical protein HY303_02775 [Candidatus Wallbacteria bacterium]|nr:hypothetical protein [Candidatus Wallbacteria bacterium]
MQPRAKLTRAEIRRLLQLLDAELAAQAVEGELCLVGGAVMCLVLDARDATRDVDGPKAGVSESWLNDAVKGFLSARGEFEAYLELPNLRVFVARPEYLLAMKCAAMWLGEEFHDLEDVRYLLRYLNISTVEEALVVVTRYFDAKQLLPKVRLALEELLSA